MLENRVNTVQSLTPLNISSHILQINVISSTRPPTCVWLGHGLQSTHVPVINNPQIQNNSLPHQRMSIEQKHYTWEW